MQKRGLVQHSGNSAIPLGKAVLNVLIAGGLRGHWGLSQWLQQGELQLGGNGELAVHTIRLGSLPLKKKVKSSLMWSTPVILALGR